MARHDDERERRHKDRHSRPRGEKRDVHETKEERLLRKAREYVDREEGNKKKRSRDDRDDDERKKKKKNKDDRKHHRSEKRRHRHDSDASDRSDSRREKKRRDEPKKKRHKTHRHPQEDGARKHRKREKDKRPKESGSKQKGSSIRKMVNKADLYPLGEVLGSPPAELIDMEKDYFAYHQHLWLYLYREEGLVFGELSSEEAHEAFQRFATRYNKGDLEAAYYDRKGLPPEALEECKTTRHSWSFNTSETERKSLKVMEEGVRKQTEYDASRSNNSGGQNIARSGAGAGSSGLSRSSNIPEDRRREKAPEERMAERVASRRLHQHIKTAEEEFSGGRKEGRERQIEKRKEKASVIHGSARDREASMGGVELDDAALYGGVAGGELNFQDAVAREKHRTARREEQRSTRVAELQQKEQDRQEAMLKMLGLSGIKPGQKITIAPRKDES